MEASAIGNDMSLAQEVRGRVRGQDKRGRRSEGTETGVLEG